MKFTHINNIYFKTVLAFILLIITIIILAFIWLTLFFNPNNYKSIIIKNFAKASNRELSLPGNIKLHIFPKTALHIDKIKINNPEEFTTGDFLVIESADLSVHLFPLFKGTVRVDNLTINQLSLNLIKQGDNNNWSLTPKDKKQTRSSINVNLKSLNLKNLKLTYTDLNNKTSRKINNLDILLITDDNGKIDLATDKANLKNVIFSIDDQLLNGHLDLNITNQEKLNYSAKLTINNFSLNKVLTKTNITLPPYVKKTPFEHISIFTQIKGDDNSLTFNNLNLKLANTNLTGNILFTSIKPLRIKNNLLIDQVDIADFTSLSGYKLKTNITQIAGNLIINPRLDLTTLNGNEKIHIKKLVLSGIDLNRFNAELNHALKGMSKFKKLAVTTKATEALRYIQEALKQTKGTKQKNYQQTTDLGYFKADLLIKKGIITTPKLILKGPNLITVGNGSVNLPNKQLNYTLNSRLLSPNPPTVINYIYYPYILTGNLDNIDGHTDFALIGKQLVRYYSTNKTEKPTLNKAYDRTKQFFKDLFSSNRIR